MARTVLVVDDHVLFAQALADVIKGMPEFELVGIGLSGPQAVALLIERQPDIVLLDYHLPGYDAEALIPRMKVLSPRSRIIVLTSDTSDAAEIKALRAGADGFLTKERAIAEVVAALAVVARGVALLTPGQLARAGLAPPPPVAKTVAPPPSLPPEPVRQTAEPPTPSPPRDAPLVVRVDGVTSFAHAVRIERAIAGLPMVRRVHLRKVDGQVGSFGVRLRPGRSEAELARALREEPSVTDVAAKAAVLRVEPNGTDG